MNRTVSVLLSLIVICTGCGAEAGSQSNGRGTIIAPIPVSYPLFIIEPDPPFCDFICIQFVPNGELICDSDCDGWYDPVELENGADPCDPFSPPFSPEPELASDVCPLIFGRTINLSRDEAQQRLDLQSEVIWRLSVASEPPT